MRHTDLTRKRALQMELCIRDILVRPPKYRVYSVSSSWERIPCIALPDCLPGCRHHTGCNCRILHAIQGCFMAKACLASPACKCQDTLQFCQQRQSMAVQHEHMPQAQLLSAKNL